MLCDITDSRPDLDGTPRSIGIVLLRAERVPTPSLEHRSVKALAAPASFISASVGAQPEEEAGASPSQDASLLPLLVRICKMSRD